MSGAAGEFSQQTEQPKPGTLARVKARIYSSMVVNANEGAKLVATGKGKSKEKEIADALHERGLWQVGMIDSLFEQGFSRRVKAASDLTKVDHAQVEKEMSATEAVKILDTWITRHETDPESRQEKDHATFMGYARDLLMKLIEEEGSVSQ